MALAPIVGTPRHFSYDVVIVGGAMMGSSVAWFLSHTPDFDGTILVVERDPRYEFCSTAHTNSCIRQQFSTDVNVRISQFGAEFIHNLRGFMGDDARVPELRIQNFGYLYLADSEAAADRLRTAHVVQAAAGAGTRLLTAAEIAAAYPFYALDDIVLGSINTLDEGYWDGITVFDWFRRQAREAGVEYLANSVVAMDRQGDRITSITLASGEVVACGTVVNCAGPRAAGVAAMAGIDLPVEPRKRFTWVFSAERPLDRPLPLTIDPSGVHVRQDGALTYMAGGHADVDLAVDPDDFAMDLSLWEDKIWPALANRIPQFEAIRVLREWAGHYAFNTLDQNAVVGPHPELSNFMFVNGFSGHGLQQSPAMGRATAEWICHGTYRSLDMRQLHFDRVLAQEPTREIAII